MKTTLHQCTPLFLSSLLLTLVLGGTPIPPPAPFTPSTAQAQSSPEAQAGRVRSLTPSEFAALNLSPQPTAFIPPGLGQSRHPQDSRGTIGDDDRIEMLSNRYPWSAIGRIVSEDVRGDTWTCTGTLVAMDIVLTNAHCVLSAETGELHRSIQFQPNLVNNTVWDLADVAEAEAVFYGTDFQEDRDPPNPNDWAFIKLDRSLGDRYGTVPWMPLPTSQLMEEYAGKLVMVGYSGDFPGDRPATSAGVHLGCSILDSYEDSIAHDCDSFGGSSGGPILAWIEDQPYIVGINSAERTNPEIVINTLTDADGNEHPVYAGLINFGVAIPTLVEFIEQQGSDRTTIHPL